jgi:HPt (histidine-containing phosphotransfer) domain-containing protein
LTRKTGGIAVKDRSRCREREAARESGQQDEHMDARSREGEIRARLADITGPEPDGPERALLARLIRSFLAKTPVGVDQLGELLRCGSPGEVRDHAHGLKGSASNLGADTLAAIFAEVEHSARDGFVPDPDLTLGQVVAEFAQVQPVLEGLAAELGA